MRKKNIAVNAGPRIGWNTDTLITEAAKGVEFAGAIVEKHETVFPQECQKAYDMGAAMVTK